MHVMAKKLENPPLLHNYREGNQVAHALDTQALTSNGDQLAIFWQPPSSVLRSLRLDKEETNFFSLL